MDIIAKLEDTDADRWDRVMAVNLRSVYLMCKAALPYLQAAGRSSIVNVSSIQASRGFSGYPGCESLSDAALCCILCCIVLH